MTNVFYYSEHRKPSYAGTGCPRKMYLHLTIVFEAVTTITLGISGLPVSPDLYISFDFIYLSAVMI